MTAERFRQIRNVFEATIDRKPEEREAFLREAVTGDDELREEVERLLRAHERKSGPIEQPAIALLGGESEPEQEPWRMEGRRIGAYEILRDIGEGGIATVYLAQRVDGAFRQRVAVKVVRREAASEEVLLRFRQERGILASLDHPHIARILDAGTLEEGLPYVVMEYVDGKPIDVHCDEHRLSVAERVALFRQVCSAIQYAHQRHVIHRDLKPSNILVTGDGVVKLLDFGIAKLLAPGNDDLTACLTRTGLMMMTPEYASPEQVKGEATVVASDVYSLGVVLYELLTGRRPYRLRSRILHEIVRVICEEPPIVPSTAATATYKDESNATTREAASRARRSGPDVLKEELSGDLDGILLKALDKNPLKRYANVERFDEDLRNHLDGRPVTAPNSMRVRAAWFAQRHPGWILAVAAVAVATLTGAVTITPHLWPMVASLALAWVVGYVANRSELGSEIARRSIPARAYLFVGIFILTMVVFALPSGLLANGLNIVWLVLIPCMSYFQLRWPFRSRWAGSLLVDVSRERPKWILIYAGFVVTCAVAFLATKTTPIVLQDIGASIGFVLLSTWASFFYGRVEIRQEGIVSVGSLIRWRSIESYGLESGQDEFDILRVQARGVRRLFPSEQIPIQKQLTDHVRAVLDERLRVWPGKGDVP